MTTYSFAQLSTLLLVSVCSMTHAAEKSTQPLMMIQSFQASLRSGLDTVTHMKDVLPKKPLAHFTIHDVNTINFPELRYNVCKTKIFLKVLCIYQEHIDHELLESLDQKVSGEIDFFNSLRDQCLNIIRCEISALEVSTHEDVSSQRAELRASRKRLALLPQL